VNVTLDRVHVSGRADCPVCGDCLSETHLYRDGRCVISCLKCRIHYHGTYSPVIDYPLTTLFFDDDYLKKRSSPEWWFDE